MAFEGLSERLENSFKKLRAKGKLTEADVKEAMREVRLALLEADVNYKVSKEFTKKVTDRAIGADVMESLPEDAGNPQRAHHGRQRGKACHRQSSAHDNYDVRLAGKR